MAKAEIKLHLALVELASVDPGLGVIDLLHEGRVRDDRLVHTGGDDALKVQRGDGVVSRPEAFAVNRLVSRFWNPLLLDQAIWIFASPSRKESESSPVLSLFNRQTPLPVSNKC